jgi:hypothetical protein
MAERLNLVGGQQIDFPVQSSSFNPRSIAVEIRTPEDLAAVNDFLVTLARDASANPRPQQPTAQVLSDDFFDPLNLSQLGLEGMPGLGTNHFNQNTYTSHAPQTYPSYHTDRVTNPSLSAHQSASYGYTLHGQSRRQTRQDPSYSHHSTYYHHPTPPLDNSSHSTTSTPGSVTPPHAPLSTPDSGAVFDYLRPARGPAPVAHLEPMDRINKTIRHTVQLRSVPGETMQDLGRPEPVEPRLSQPIHRGPPARLTSLSSVSAPLYPSLKLQVDKYKLPPLNYRSSSPSSRDSTPSSSPSSPASHHTVLPSLRSITCDSEPEQEDLAKKVDGIDIRNAMKEICPEERRRHVSLIRDILVAINTEYRERYGTPQLAVDSGTSRDVEMAPAWR